MEKPGPRPSGLFPKKVLQSKEQGAFYPPFPVLRHLSLHLLPHFNIYTPHAINSPPSHPAKEKKKRKKHFPKPDVICKVDKEIERGLFAYKKALIGPLLKLTSVDGKSVEDTRNFPGVLRTRECT